MNKYKVGEILADKYNSDVFFKILAVAPEKDFEGYECYFVEVLDKGNKYFVCYDPAFLDAWAERETNDDVEFV